jgi:hypothetical protein
MEKAKEQSKEELKKTPPEFRRDEDFIVRYANNAQFEVSSWDLKITFGQTDLAIGPNVVVQHTAMTMPWPYVKVFSYLFQVQVAAHEAENGHIEVPHSILNAPPPSLSEEVAATLKHPKEGLEAIKKLWKEFVAANPELEK